MNKFPPKLTFAALCGVSLILWHRPLLDTFALAMTNDEYTHILLILPVVVALIFQARRERGFQPELWMGAAGLLLVVLLVAAGAKWGHPTTGSDVQRTIDMVSLVMWWNVSFLLCFGSRYLRAFRFPLFFLFALAPLPKIVLDPIITILQRGSTVAAQALFLLFRVPVYRDSTTLLIPGLEIDVTTECSSIRSSLILLVTTMVLAHLLLKTSWRKAFLVLIALPLSVAKNGLRIFTIGMLGSKVDPSYLTGHLHRQGGIIFLLIALAGVFVLLWILRRSETVVPPRQLHPQTP
jgi:exosortase